MAFQRKRAGGGNSPALSVQLSVKQGNGYTKGPNFGFWANEQGGPAFRGTLKEDKLAEVLEFLSNAYDANLPVSMAMFDNAAGSAPAKKPFSNGFKKSGASFGAKKPNPFKRQAEPEGEDSQEEPEF